MIVPLPSSMPPSAITAVGDSPAADRAVRRRSFLRALATVARGEPSRTELVSVLAVVQGALCIVAVVQTALLAPPEIFPAVAPVLLGAAVLYLGVYTLARHRRAKAASWVMVSAQVLISPLVLAGLPASQLAPMSTAAWGTIAILTASATLGSRAVLITGVVNVTVLPISVALASELRLPVDECALYHVSITSLVYLYARHRDARERVRHSLIEARNRELEDLRGGLEQRVEERTRELEQAAQRLESAYRAQQAQHQLLVQTEKMAAVGRLSAGFAHELASPLQAIVAAADDAQHLRREYAESIADPSVTPADHHEIAREMEEALEMIETAAKRCVRFVTNIRAHTRDPGPQAVELFEASKVSQDSVELLAYAARHAGVRLSVESDGGRSLVLGVPSRFHQVVTNLVQNAIDAVSEARRDGNVRVRVTREQGEVVVSVEDDGPGVPPTIASSIFEPMFTTKPYGKGTGLGLSIARDIVCDELGGSLEVHDRTGGGAAFVVRAPSAES